MVRGESQYVKRAKDILRGQHASPQEILELVREGLKKERAFGYARKLLGRAREAKIGDEKLRRELRQEHALCTYKDPELPAHSRLDRALEILEDTDNEQEKLQATKDQETLGLAGAIYKRRWGVDTQKQNLERSLAYYHRGYDQGVATDHGYTGINAAFVLDLLGRQEEAEARKAGTASEGAAARRRQAQLIREDIVSTLTALPDPSNEWWFSVTIAEAYFGLRRYPEALPYLRQAAAMKRVPDWERESTARQLAALARLQEGSSISASKAEESEAWRVLSEFLGNNLAAVRSAYLGKIGLALSGGGFRASLFHIGVLAKLAELDMLRNVGVLSCVSGGSIIGAHYYLEIRRLLETKRDDQITREDYIKLVQRIERDFLAGVQRNIRTRVAAEFLTNLKMAFMPNYSRTKRAGELYEREIFSRVNDGGQRTERWLNDLTVQPLGEPPDFVPKNHNWRRSAKVPILMLNATSLNTGHTWQLTVTWMGEPPAGIDSEIDGNYRLRRMYYDEAPQNHQKIRLGYAVAASACVPGLFEPLPLADLYPDMTVRLIDGGVHDNQGIGALLEQDCTVLLVSDASGQMDAQNYPSNGLLGVPLRSNSILQARVREAQYHELNARRRATLLQGLMFLHVKRDLGAPLVDWINCQDPSDASEEAIPAARRGPLTRYGIRKDVQERLAAVRTDLDSFSEAEAYALMTSGYCMTEYEFPRCVESFLPSYRPF